MAWIEPVTLAEAKAHCRIEHDTEDALIQQYIASARAYCEGYLNATLAYDDEDTQAERVQDIMNSLKPTWKQAILLIVADSYQNRENMEIKTALSIPTAAERLLSLDRHFPF